MTDIQARFEELRNAAIESAFQQPDIFNREYLENYHQWMISEAQKSIRFLTDGLTQLIRLRDKYQHDFETAELIWNNIRLTRDAIKEESENITSLRGDMKRGS